MWGISREMIVRCIFPRITNEHLDKIIALGNNYHLDDENFSDALESLSVTQENFALQLFARAMAPKCRRCYLSTKSVKIYLMHGNQILI